MLFGWMPTTLDDRAHLHAPERSDQRRQDVVAIFGVTDRITVVVFAELGL
jgi:hypothetical protein